MVHGITSLLEYIKLNAERPREIPEKFGVRINERLRSDTGALGRLDIFQSVVVTPRKEQYLVALEPMIARDRISQNKSKGVPDMGFCVHIGNRRRDVEFFMHCCHARKGPFRALATLEERRIETIPVSSDPYP